MAGRTFCSIAVFVVILLGFAAPSWSQSSSKRILVLPLEANVEINSNYITDYSNKLVQQVERLSNSRIFSENSLDIPFARLQQLAKCDRENIRCLTKISGDLGMDEIVSGKLGLVGGYWVLRLVLISISEEKPISQAGIQVSGDIGKLEEAIPGAIRTLFNINIEKGDSSPTESEESAYRIAAYSLIGGGLLFVAFGGVGSWFAVEAQNDYNDSRGADTNAKSDFNTWRAVSITGYALGGAAILTGVTFWILDAKGVFAKRDENTVTIDLIPTRTGGALTISGSW